MLTRSYICGTIAYMRIMSPKYKFTFSVQGLMIDTPAKLEGGAIDQDVEVRTDVIGRDVETAVIRWSINQLEEKRKLKEDMKSSHSHRKRIIDLVM